MKTYRLDFRYGTNQFMTTKTARDEQSAIKKALEELHNKEGKSTKKTLFQITERKK